MKRTFNLLIVILLLSFTTKAQSRNSINNLSASKYIARNITSNSSEPEPIRWYQFEHADTTSKSKGVKKKETKVVKKSKTVKTTKGSHSYILSNAVPYYSSSRYWQYSDSGILRDSIITSTAKRKTYGKEQFVTLKRHYREGKEKETLTKALSVLKYSSLDADLQQEIELLDFVGAFCSENNLFKEAEYFYRSALANRLLEPEFFNYGEISLKLAEVLNKQRNYDESLKFASFALTEYTNAGNREGLASSNLLIADIYLSRGDLSVAEKIILNKVLGNFTYVGNQTGRTACFEKLGQIYLKLNRISEAKWFFIQQNMLSNAQGNKLEEFNSLVDLGKTKIAIGDYQLALKDLRKANTFLNDNSSVASRLKLEQAYGQLFRKQGNKKLSKLSMQKSKKLKSSLEKDQTTQRKAAYKLLNFSKEEKQNYFASAVDNDI